MNTRWKKNTAAMLAVGHPRARYLATGCASYAVDMMNKVRKALALGGPTFMHTLDPCPKGWDYDPKYSHELGMLAVETGLWVQWEVEDGKLRYNGPSRMIATGRRKRKSIVQYLKRQGRFAHFKEEDIAYFESQVNDIWEKWGTPGVSPMKLDLAGDRA